MMSWIVSLYGFMEVLLRGLVLIAQSLTLGGVVFLLIVVPWESEFSTSIRHSVERWIRRGALLLAVVEGLYAALEIAVLMQSGGFTFRDVIAANFALAGFLAVASSLAIAILIRAESRRRQLILLVPSTLILVAAMITSHAMARLENRLPLIVLTAAHQGATAAWIGGLPFLLISLKQLSAPDLIREVCARFSRLAMVSVTVLAAAGFGLSRFYVGSWDAIYGATYGIMVVGKIVLFGILLSLGALNFRIVRRLGDTGWFLRSLLHFGEVEIGVGFTVILLAASLTSLAPAVDTPMQTLRTADIAARMMPQWPPQIMAESAQPTHPTDRLEAKSATSKTVQTESPIPSETSQASGAASEERWMDNPHHWAALVVLPCGLLALLGRLKRFRVAQNWPLLFPALGLVLFLMSDSQYWPLGSGSIWNSFLDPVVLPHRIIEVLIAVFGIFEWKVQTQGVTSTKASLVFPSVVAFSSALLLAHSHSVADSQLQEELVSEASHISIAVLGIAGGWSRWLELRLPSGDRTRRVMSWIWPVCFLIIGILLACYQGDS
jgi:putative copper resistance protein D